MPRCLGTLKLPEPKPADVHTHTKGAAAAGEHYAQKGMEGTVLLRNGQETSYFQDVQCRCPMHPAERKKTYDTHNNRPISASRNRAARRTAKPKPLPAPVTFCIIRVAKLSLMVFQDQLGTAENGVSHRNIETYKPHPGILHHARSKCGKLDLESAEYHIRALSSKGWSITLWRDESVAQCNKNELLLTRGNST